MSLFTASDGLADVPAPPGDSNCKYRLDNGTSDTLTLPDGRKLGYAQYGSQTGVPILYLHGFPGSRLEVSSLHDLGVKLGARIISTDRPGIGLSSPHPGRKLLDFPKDLECLAEHLGLESYSALGVSGGGPYALACAASMPKLRCASIVCGLGPPDIGMKGADLVHRIGFGFGGFGFRYAWVGAIRWFFSREPGGRLDLSDEERFEMQMQLASKVANEKDLIFYNNADLIRVYLRSSREAFAHGFEATRDDGRLICSDFGFRLQEFRSDLSVHLWYGKQDTFVPLNHGVQIAARLAERAQLRVEDETHASIWFRWREEVLRNIIRVHTQSRA